jgi:hypothetical protein
VEDLLRGPLGLARGDEESAPGAAGLTGPDPHAGGDADHEGEEEPEEGELEAEGPLARPWHAALGGAAVEGREEGEGAPAGPCLGLLEGAGEAAEGRQDVQEGEHPEPRHQALEFGGAAARRADGTSDPHQSQAGDATQEAAQQEEARLGQDLEPKGRLVRYLAQARQLVRRHVPGDECTCKETKTLVGVISSSSFAVFDRALGRDP